MFEEIDNYITETLYDKYNYNFERRNSLSKLSNGHILYLADVSYENYIYVYLFNTNQYKLKFVQNNFKLISGDYYDYNNFYEIFKYFLSTVDNYMELKKSFHQISNGIDPKKLRQLKIERVYK